MDEFIEEMLCESRKFRFCNLYMEEGTSQFARSKTPKNRYKIVVPTAKHAEPKKKVNASIF